MAAMKCSAVRNPKDRWLMDLILLFIPSTAPLDRRCLVHARIPSRCPRSMRTNFLNGSSRERMAERIHFSKCSSARLRPLGLLVIPEQLEGFFEVVGAHDRRVPPHHRRQAFFLVVTEIPWILQQQPAAALECHLLLLTQAAHFTAPDIFDRLVEVLDDVEPVKQDLGIGRVVFHQLGVASALTRNDPRSPAWICGRPTLLAKSDPAPRRSGGAFAAGQEVFLPAGNSRAKPGPPHSGG